MKLETRIKLNYNIYIHHDLHDWTIHDVHIHVNHESTLHCIPAKRGRSPEQETVHNGRQEALVCLGKNHWPFTLERIAQLF